MQSLACGCNLLPIHCWGANSASRASIPLRSLLLLTSKRGRVSSIVFIPHDPSLRGRHNSPGWHHLRVLANTHMTFQGPYLARVLHFTPSFLALLFDNRAYLLLGGGTGPTPYLLAVLHYIPPPDWESYIDDIGSCLPCFESSGEHMSSTDNCGLTRPDSHYPSNISPRLFGCTSSASRLIDGFQYIRSHSLLRPKHHHAVASRCRRPVRLRVFGLGQPL